MKTITHAREARFWGLLVLALFVQSCAPSKQPEQPVAIEPPDPPAPVFTYAQLQAEGDRFMAAKHPFLALADYQRASELDPTQAGLFFRLANAAADAWQGERGIDALYRLAMLKPASVEDADVKNLRARLAKLPPRNVKVNRENTALESLFFDYKHDNGPSRKAKLIAKAHARLAPLICLSFQYDPDIWRYAGYVAVAEENANWGRFASESLAVSSISRVGYLQAIEVTELQSALSRLPGSGIQIQQYASTYRLYEPAGRSEGGAESYQANRVVAVPDYVTEEWAANLSPEVAVHKMLDGSMPFDLPVTLEMYNTILQNYDRSKAATDESYALDVAYVAEDLGDIYCYGRLGERIDFDKAKYYYELSSSLDRTDGHIASGPLNAGKNWESGHFGRYQEECATAPPLVATPALVKNSATAKQWYLVAAECSRDDGDALYHIALEFDTGVGPADLTDEPKAVELFRRAAGLGNTDAMLAFGMEYWVGENLPQNDTLAIDWITKSARGGNTRAQTFCNKKGWRW